jgi:hypothetical protein
MQKENAAIKEAGIHQKIIATFPKAKNISCIGNTVVL